MATASEQRTGLIEVADGVFAKIYPEGRTNGGFVVGDAGVLVIDSLRSSAQGRELSDDVRRVTAKPIRYLLNTHYHWDHTSGNQEFVGVPIVAHANCREELRTRGEEALIQAAERFPEAAAELRAVRLTLPDLTFPDTLTLHIGRPVELRYFGRGHTSGDVVAWLPEQRVVFAGDLLAARMAPGMADAYVSEWIAVVERLEELRAQVVVPGHGYLAGNAELREERAFLTAIWTRATAAHALHEPDDAAARSLRLDAWRGWPRIENAALGLRRALRELRGEL
jgi:cyclase